MRRKTNSLTSVVAVAIQHCPIHASPVSLVHHFDNRGQAGNTLGSAGNRGAAGVGDDFAITVKQPERYDDLALDKVELAEPHSPADAGLSGSGGAGGC